MPAAGDWTDYCLARVQLDAELHAACSGGDLEEWRAFFRRLASCENAPVEIIDGTSELDVENARRLLSELADRQCADRRRVVLEQLTRPIAALGIGESCGLECLEGSCRRCGNEAHCSLRGPLANRCVARIGAGSVCDDLGVPCVVGADCSAGRCRLGPGLRCVADDECESKFCDSGRCQSIDPSPDECGPDDKTAIGLSCEALACLGPGLGSPCDGNCRDPHLFCSGEGRCSLRPMKGMECSMASEGTGDDPCFRSACVEGTCRDALGD